MIGVDNTNIQEAKYKLHWTPTKGNGCLLSGFEFCFFSCLESNKLCSGPFTSTGSMLGSDLQGLFQRSKQ